jgi:hypothetical protein
VHDGSIIVSCRTEGLDVDALSSEELADICEYTRPILDADDHLFEYAPNCISRYQDEHS